MIADPRIVDAGLPMSHILNTQSSHGNSETPVGQYVVSGNSSLLAAIEQLGEKAPVHTSVEDFILNRRLVDAFHCSLGMPQLAAVNVQATNPPDMLAEQFPQQAGPLEPISTQLLEASQRQS